MKKTIEYLIHSTPQRMSATAAPETLEATVPGESGAGGISAHKFSISGLLHVG